MPGWWECRLVQPPWRTVWNSLRKLKRELPSDPLLGLPWEKPKTRSQKNLFTQVRGSVIHKSQGWKQPPCPQDTGE